jgi:ArsR family transcriptional regulator
MQRMTTALTVDTDRAAELFHALSDTVRLEVIGLLLGGEHCVCELIDHLDIGQSRLSWHLKTLGDAGIIVGRKEGRWVYYSLDMYVLAEAGSLLGAMKPAARRKSSGSSCC